MNRKEFLNELKELASAMSAEEIEHTINELNKCKTDVWENANAEKSDRARLLLMTERIEATLDYVNNKGCGQLKVAGATLLGSKDYYKFQGMIPPRVCCWWLYDMDFVKNNRVERPCFMEPGVIRPVIIIDEIIGELAPGESFKINGTAFTLLSDTLAIKNDFIPFYCYSSGPYDNTQMRYFVNGWWRDFISNAQSIKSDTVSELSETD